MPQSNGLSFLGENKGEARQQPVEAELGIESLDAEHEDDLEIEGLDPAQSQDGRQDGSQGKREGDDAALKTVGEESASEEPTIDWQAKYENFAKEQERHRSGSIHALTVARNEKREAEAENQRLREQLAALNGGGYAPSEEGYAGQEQPETGYDPFQNNRLSQVEAENQRLMEQSQQANVAFEQMQRRNLADEAAKALPKAIEEAGIPDYQAAEEFGVNHRIQEIIQYGYSQGQIISEPQAQEMVLGEVATLVAQVSRNGGNPAHYLYSLAQARGYVPQRPAPIENFQRAEPEVPISMSDLGGEGASSEPRSRLSFLGK